MGKTRKFALCIGIVSLINISFCQAGIDTLFTDRSSLNTPVESTTLAGFTDSAHFAVSGESFSFSSGLVGLRVGDIDGNRNLGLATDNHSFGGRSAGAPPVQEPAIMLLLGSILVFLAGISKRKKKLSKHMLSIKAGLEKILPWFVGIKDSYREHRT